MKYLFWQSVVVIGLAISFLCEVSAQERGAGTWQRLSVAQVNIACIQTWKCVNPPIIHDPNYRVVTTSNENTTGTCLPGTGPADSCNTCVASEPSTPCEYWLVERNTNQILNFDEAIQRGIARHSFVPGAIMNPTTRPLDEPILHGTFIGPVINSAPLDGHISPLILNQSQFVLPAGH